MPSEPVSIAAMSDSMSPNRLSVTIDVELLGLADQLHAAGVGELVLERDVLELALMQLRHHLVPEHAGLHDVALLHRGDLVLALARQLEGDAADALDLVGVVDLGVDGALLAVAEIGDGLRLAEIDAAGELAQDDDVEALDQLALERRGVGQRRIVTPGGGWRTARGPCAAAAGPPPAARRRAPRPTSARRPRRTAPRRRHAPWPWWRR